MLKMREEEKEIEDERGREKRSKMREEERDVKDERGRERCRR